MANPSLIHQQTVSKVYQKRIKSHESRHRDASEPRTSRRSTAAGGNTAHEPPCSPRMPVRTRVACCCLPLPAVCGGLAIELLLARLLVSEAVLCLADAPTPAHSRPVSAAHKTLDRPDPAAGAEAEQVLRSPRMPVRTRVACCCLPLPAVGSSSSCRSLGCWRQRLCYARLLTGWLVRSNSRCCAARNGGLALCTCRE